MIISFFIYGLAYLALGICLYAARTDTKSLTIHNGTVVSVALIFIAAFCLDKIYGLSIFQSLSAHLYSFIWVFGISFVLFSLGTLGGGDAKLAAALALWLPVNALSGFIMIMALTGGVLGLIAVALRNKSFLKPTTQEGWIAALSRGESTVPYGVALAIAATYAFTQQGYLGV